MLGIICDALVLREEGHVNHAALNWKQGIDWNSCVATVIKYYAEKPHLKFGPTRLNKALPLLDHLCAQGEVMRTELIQAHDLECDDDVMTILSNVTMAIQGSGKVWSPQSGGWYTSYYQINGDYDTLTYIVCPGFAEAWKVRRRYK
jgi:hypothetical protein